MLVTLGVKVTLSGTCAATRVCARADRESAAAVSIAAWMHFIIISISPWGNGSNIPAIRQTVHLADCRISSDLAKEV